MTGQDRFALGKAGMEIGHPVSRGTLKATRPTWPTRSSPFPTRQAGQQPYTAGSHWMWVVGKWVSDVQDRLEVGLLLHQQARADRVERHRRRPAQLQGTGRTTRASVKNENDKMVMDSLKYATPWEWVGWAEWVKELGDGRDRVVIGDEAPEKSFNTMVENLNKVIETHTPKS